MLLMGRPRFILPVAVGALFLVGTLFYISQPAYIRSDSLGFDHVRFPHHPHALPPPPIRFPPKPTSQPHSLWNARAEEVKQAFVHAYTGYRKYAMGYDELKPKSNEPRNK